MLIACGSQRVNPRHMNTTGKHKDQITPVKRAGKLKAWRQTTLQGRPGFLCIRYSGAF